MDTLHPLIDVQKIKAVAAAGNTPGRSKSQNSSPLLYIQDAIKMRRQGNDILKLPQISTPVEFLFHLYRVMKVVRHMVVSTLND